MREILFKAKRKDNGEWIEGYYIYHIKRTPCPIGDSVKPEDEQHVIMCDGFSDWSMPRGTVYFDIDPDTLCQYTGFKDKNGNRIWENDIVKSTASNDERDWKLWKVIFVDGSFVFAPIAYVDKTRKKLRSEDELLCEDNIKLYGLERSGNIFDENTPTNTPTDTPTKANTPTDIPTGGLNGWG